MKERNCTTDVAKTICAFMVVFIHSGPNDLFGTYFKVLSTAAVPFFLMVSGYYLFSRTLMAEMSDYIDRQIRKLFFLYLFSGVVYVIFGIALTLLLRESVAEFCRSILNVDSIIGLLLYNHTPFAYHLWYIGTAMYSLFFIKQLTRVKGFAKIVRVMPILFLASIMLGTYSKILFLHDNPIYLSRNSITIGLPCVALGGILNCYRNKLAKVIQHSPALIAIFAIAIIVERYVLHRSNVLAPGSNFLFTVPLASALLLWAIGNCMNSSNPLIAHLAFIGKNDSTNIYIYHLLFVMLLDVLLPSCNSLITYAKPVLVFGLALGLSRAITFFKHLVSHTAVR